MNTVVSTQAHTVLVTRPSPEGEQLCCLLRAAGFYALHQPLIGFAAGDDSAALTSGLGKADIVIAVSKPAVSWAETALQSSGHSWPVEPVYLAVGQKTADKLSQATQQAVHCPEISDSEHLLQLPALQQVDSQRILILRGNGGRELIRAELQCRGAEVDYCEVYQRRALPVDGQALIQEWQAQQVDHIVVTSAEQLSILTGLVPDDDLGWLKQQILLVPSQRIADIASRMGFHRVKATGSASNPDLLATIQSLSTTG